MELDPFSLPLSDPLETAAGTVDAREGFVVRAAVEGVDGVGEATPLPGWTESLEACERALRSIEDPASVLGPSVGESGDSTERSRSDSLGDAPAARHGVSLAALDARARAADRPLYRYLGADATVDAVPVNATIGAGSPAAAAAAATRAVDDGFPAVKVKVGVNSPDADVERLAAVREACPDVELRADANGAWTAEEADRALERFGDLDVALVEQPLPGEDLEGHAALRGRGVDVALDEGVIDHGIEAVLDAEAADVVVCKPMALGGVDLAREVARRALDAGIDPVVTTTVDGAYARAAAVHLAASLPDVRACGLATGDRLTADLRSDAAPIRAGAAVVPQGKGNVPPS